MCFRSGPSAAIVVVVGTVSLAILAVGTLALVALSWFGSLRARRYHGVFRFFAFESVLVLILVNAPWWFTSPFSPRQLASWALLFASAILAVHGGVLLTRVGRPEGQLEETTRLVEKGAYRYIRHPLYLTLILGGLGAWLKHLSWTSSACLLVDLASVYLTAKVEEREMLQRFADDYASYMKRTRMFIPYLF